MCNITAPSVVLLPHTTGLTKDRGRGSTREKANNRIKTQYVCFSSRRSDFYLLFLGEQFLFLPASCNFPSCISPVMLTTLGSWSSFNLESWFFFGSLLAKQVFPVLRALHVTEVITGLSSLIICIGKSLLLQKELWKRERYLNVTDVNFCIYLSVYVYIYDICMHFYVCMSDVYIHCCSCCYKVLFQMEHLLITTLNLTPYTVNSFNTLCLHTTADCTFITWWHMK